MLAGNFCVLAPPAPIVIRGLDPRIHQSSKTPEIMDRRVKPGNDKARFYCSSGGGERSKTSPFGPSRRSSA